MSHYDYLDTHLPAFFASLDISWDHNAGIITAHGDKCYSHKGEWADHGIPFPHGVAIYLLTYCNPFADEVRETAQGWVHPHEWVIQNYDRFKNQLPNVS